MFQLKWYIRLPVAEKLGIVPI